MPAASLFRVMKIEVGDENKQEGMVRRDSYGRYGGESLEERLLSSEYFFLDIQGLGLAFGDRMESSRASLGCADHHLLMPTLPLLS